MRAVLDSETGLYRPEETPEERRINDLLEELVVAVSDLLPGNSPRRQVLQSKLNDLKKLRPVSAKG